MKIFTYFIFALLCFSEDYNFADGAYLKIEITAITILGLVSYSLVYLTLFEKMSDELYSPHLKIILCLALHLIAVAIFYMKYRKHYRSTKS